MRWIKLKDQLPKVSYLESDIEDDPYESYPVLVFSKERPGIICVAHLVMEQDENNWSCGELSWELYIPGAGGEIIERNLEQFDYWMELPAMPENEE